jgi:hypothetical protein
VWPLHTWLAWAHSNSPLAGSILLAATVLKFATYGILRVLINFLPDATNYFSPLVQTMVILSLVYASLTTIIQQDTKTLVAYSSVALSGPKYEFALFKSTISIPQQIICIKIKKIQGTLFNYKINIQLLPSHAPLLMGIPT